MQSTLCLKAPGFFNRWIYKVKTKAKTWFSKFAFRFNLLYGYVLDAWMDAHGRGWGAAYGGGREEEVGLTLFTTVLTTVLSQPFSQLLTAGMVHSV
jgi:hypothetical protein